MRAAVHTRYGPPEVVGIAEVADPVIGNEDVLVRVHATTVNRTDTATRAARPWPARLVTGLVRPKATILGCEFAGEVEAVGADVTRFAVGDRVFGYNEGPFGAHAEYLCIPERGSMATVPEGWDYEQVAPGTEGSHYALTMLAKAAVGEGDDVLVHGATGAIGSAAVQLAKSAGARVTAVCASPHLELVRGLGADRVIDYTVEDFTADQQIYDLVIDAVGKSTFGACRRLLGPRGVYCSSELGPWLQNPILALATPLVRRRRVIFPVPTHDQQMVEHLRCLLESGDFVPLIDRRYELDQIVDAHRYVETGQKIGNVVVAVRPSGAMPPS